jgi:hypothetical protein
MPAASAFKLNSIIVLCVICIGSIGLHACQEKVGRTGETFRVDYVWDSKFRIVNVKDENGSDVTDKELRERITREAERVLPALMRIKKFNRAEGTFHFRPDSGLASEILEARLGPDPENPEFIKDPTITPLMRYAKGAQVDQMQALISRGADVNAKDQLGNTPLMSAVSSRKVEAVRLLLDHGADLNTRNQDGETALTLSVISWQQDIVAELTRRGAFLDCANPVDRETYLRVFRQKELETEVIPYLRKGVRNCGDPQK